MGQRSEGFFSPNRHGTATRGGVVKFGLSLSCVKSHVSRTTGAIFSGDVSGKRFNTHVVEGNVAGVVRGNGTAA